MPDRGYSRWFSIKRRFSISGVFSGGCQDRETGIGIRDKMPNSQAGQRKDQQPGGRAAVTQQQHERRARERVTLRCAAYVFMDGVPGVIRATTTNISSCGLFCHSDVQLPPGERFRCLIEMTPDGFRSGNGSTLLECFLEVVRTVEQGSELGMGCRIREYRLLRAQESHLPETDGADAGA
jgi:hypothetical protein